MKPNEEYNANVRADMDNYPTPWDEGDPAKVDQDALMDEAVFNMKLVGNVLEPVPDGEPF